VRRPVAALVAAILLAGCARQGLTLLPEADLPGDVYGPPQPAPEPEQIPANGRIFLVERAHLVPARVTLQPVADSLAEALLVALFPPGPQGSRSSTEIPDGTRLNAVDVAGGVATVDVSGDFERAAPPRSQALRIAQVVYTLTDEGTGIGGVRFEIDGVPQEAIGGAQLGTILGPVTRGDYADFAPRAKEPAKKGH
jgi:sporulation and spore germination protein/putative VirB-like lipoprotein